MRAEGLKDDGNQKGEGGDEWDKGRGCVGERGDVGVGGRCNDLSSASPSPRGSPLGTS